VNNISELCETYTKKVIEERMPTLQQIENSL